MMSSLCLRRSLGTNLGLGLGLAHARGLVLGLVLAACASAPPPSSSNAPPPSGSDAAPPPPAPASSAQPPPAFPYPAAQEIDHTDEYHGTRIKDPYRWLEDPDSEETRKWITAQNELTFGWLGKIAVREDLKRRLTELWNYERYSPPAKRGKRYFYSKNDGLQNQSVLYWLDRLDGTPKQLLDPNQLSTDGTIALSGTESTDDGTLLAYALSTGGSDWKEWRVRDVATGKDLPDHLRWSKFSGASWTTDKKGFFYSRYPEPKEGAALEEANFNQKLYYHRLGTQQSEDELVFEEPEHPRRGFDGHVTEDGRWLIITVWEGTDRRNRLYYKDLKKKGAPVFRLFDAFDASYSFVGSKGEKLYVMTDRGAPRSMLVEVDVKKPEPWKVLIPEGKDKLESISMIGGGLLAVWLEDARNRVTFHDLKGVQKRVIELPTLGTAYGFDGRSDAKETFYAFTSFTYPTTIFRLDLASGKSTLFRAPKVPFDPAAYEARQVKYTSRDGTVVPMFLVHKKGLEMNGDNPTYLYGYGGFNISLTPAFSVATLAWVERGYVYAQPTLRGGGEFGEEWHQAGMLEKKQNVFDDFTKAAEWLIENRVTSPKRLAIGGGSNGGLLVGASIVQRPDLFGAAVVQVGVLDMLRFHKFTIGHAWTSEYGSPDDPQHFPVLLRYSPLHNLKAGTAYPATLITTADHDDRVVPAHSFKFTAALQKAQGGPAPILIRVDVKAGHGAGKPTTKQIDEAADRWTFVIDRIAR